MIYVLRNGDKYYAGIEHKQIRETEEVKLAAKFNEIEGRARIMYLERTYGIRYEFVAVSELQEC